MNVFIVFIAIFFGIVAIGAIIIIVYLINNRPKARIKKHISDEETQSDIAEQYRRVYDDRRESNLK